ncbi:MAG TPA: 5-oxoprolinase subunit PxpB [Opitutus sp.]|nr:5-oxoprolinase subunit PxpB [Opitutus sp.]
MTFAPLGDSAVVVTLGTGIDEATLLRARSLSAALERERGAGVVDVVPAYTTVTVFYENAPHPPDDVPPYERICQLISARLRKTDHSWPDVVRDNLGGRRDEAARVEIPVCYGGEMGPDLEEVAGRADLKTAEVIELHSAAGYVVHAIGFTPGFPYLGGLPERLRTPRRATPRTSVPAGSVGIGGEQTGVYPIATPGGWQLIGRTPLALFQVTENPPARLRVGDHVKFKPITAREFAAWK